MFQEQIPSTEQRVSAPGSVQNPPTSHIQTIHESDKDYECKPCGKSFTQARSLRIHILIIHEGHKNHSTTKPSATLTKEGQTTSTPEVSGDFNIFPELVYFKFHEIFNTNYIFFLISIFRS